jgi:pseudouridine kinase
MNSSTEILCIGSVLWDVIGRSASTMRVGSDVPGRITRLPGGVALNIAMTLRRFDLTPSLLSVVGQDAVGDELVKECDAMGLETSHIYRSRDLPTDRYMAVEGQNGLIAAIADAHSLEQAGRKILASLMNGTLGDANTPYSGVIALDGNLTENLLREIAGLDEFSKADLRVAPASPGKADRLIPLIGHAGTTLYVNREEAELICRSEFDDATSAAIGLLEKGASRVLVTDGGRSACDGHVDGVLSAKPQEVLVTRITGAGDTFMAAHIAAEIRGLPREEALEAALNAAATYVSGDIGA